MGSAIGTGVADDAVMSKIYLIRGQKVMLDADLAELYNVETKRLKEAVRRNIERFPPDFMFKLTLRELTALRTQFATSKNRGGSRYLPMAFTEQGVSMLSSVLNSKIAIQVNIRIIRVFTRMRELVASHKDILHQLEKMEGRVNKHDEDIAMVFSYLKELLNPEYPPRRQIGFRTDTDQ